MFKKRICPYCSEKIDDALETCPKCHHIITKSTNKVTFLPFWKQITLFAIGAIGFQVIGLFLTLLIQLIAKNVLQPETAYKEYINSIYPSMIVNFAAYGIITIALMFTLFKDIKPLLKTFKNWRVPVSAIIGYAVIFTFNLIYSAVLQSAGIQMSVNDNELLLREIIKNQPLLSFFIFGIIGPICEEITYRVGFYSFFRRINKYLAIVLTVIVFAFIHFDFAAKDITNELLNIPMYLVAAFVFSFLYEKWGFASSLSAHLINNVISILATITSVLKI